MKLSTIKKGAKSVCKVVLAILFLGLSLRCNEPQQKAKPEKEAIAYCDLVYPQLDTENSRWFLFSSASRPFGMVNLSPDTKVGGAWGSGYRYETDTIKGFSHIHGWQISGLSVMPVMVDEQNKDQVFTDFYSKFSHETEIAAPGLHRVTLEKYGIKVGLTSTKRVGFHQYSFPKDMNKKPAVLFNLNTILGPSDNVEGVLKEMDSKTIIGELQMTPTHRRPKPFKLFFHLQFNTEIDSMVKDAQTGNYLVFAKNDQPELLMKVGLSYTSHENAKGNSDRELSHWNYDEVVEQSQKEWNSLLGRIKIEGGTLKQQRRFYTDLWHALQGRRTINDSNGAYPDNTGKEFRIGQLPLDENGTPKFDHFNSDSFWGAQWTINTLWGLVYPDIKEAFVQSLLQYYKDGGLIPRGPSGGNYTYVMTGSSSTPFIVSAIQEGIIKTDLENVYQALKKNHMLGGIMEKAGYEHTTALGGGLKHYMDNGFVPYPIPEGKFGGHQDGASLTLEYAYQDWTLAQLAKKLGHTNDYEYFAQRGLNYKNVFDPAVNWMRPKNSEGIWMTDFDPYLYENGFNEANGAQATWFVPHDIQGLAELMGGPEVAVKKLNQQFEEAEKLGFTSGNSHDRERHPEYSRIPINYGNQPSMQTAFVFHELGRPNLTEYWSHKVIDSVFSGLDPSTGYNGDEDQGLMGSLAVLLKLGMFQMTGGTEADPEYQLTPTIFDKVTIELHPKFYEGKTVSIVRDTNLTPEGSRKFYWNNIELNQNQIKHSQLTAGGVLSIQKQ